jgi:hypothetical protein
MMGSVPIPMVVVVVMIITTFIAAVAAGQSKYYSAKEKKGTQHVFERVLHNFLFKAYLSKILPDVKRRLTGA